MNIARSDFTSSIYCVGRNYAAHARELNNPIPEEPIIFTKSPSCVVPFAGDISIPLALGRCDHEVEIVVQVNQDLYQHTPEQALEAISHVGVALDLTLRDKQSELKARKHPWHLAKNFLNACPLSPLNPVSNGLMLDDLDVKLAVNGEVRQQGSTKQMLYSIPTLISFISQQLPIKAGDLVLTGTPANVAPLEDQDQLVASLNDEVVGEARIIRQ